MMDDDEFEDNAKYEALAEEMAEPDDSDSLTGLSRDDDDGDAGGEPLEARERGEDTGGDDDADAVERASLEADDLEYQMQERQRYNQQYERPNVWDDPIGHLQSLGQELEQRRARDEYQSFLNTIDHAEENFKVLQPDYAEGVKVLEASRRNELAQMFPDRSAQAHLVARRQGFRSPKELREAIFVQDAQTVARNALAAGINPAKAYFDLAKERGYKPKPGRAAPSRGGRSGGRSSGGKSGGFHAGMNVSQMADLYSEDPEEFDRQWDKAARSGALG